MGTISVNRLAGLSLIFGPIVAFVFFLIEPGGLLIDSAEPSDAVGTITAKGANAALTNVTNIAIILGLALILSGLYALMRNVTLEGNGKAFVQMGFFMVFVGLTGWIFAGGVDFILADAQTSEQISGSVPSTTPAPLSSTPVGSRSGLAAASSLWASPREMTSTG